VTPCDETRNQDYILDLLTPEEVAAQEEHLRRCVLCTRQVAEYRVLFSRLAEVPMPAVPAGIPERVLARLHPEPEGAWARMRNRIAAIIARPLTVPIAGIASGLLLALFRERLLLYVGRMTSDILTGWTAELIRGVRTGISQYSDWTVILEVAIGLVLKLEPLVRALTGAAPALVGWVPLLLIALSLAMALLFWRLLGQLRREEYGHAKR